MLVQRFLIIIIFFAINATSHVVIADQLRMLTRHETALLKQLDQLKAITQCLVQIQTTTKDTPEKKNVRHWLMRCIVAINEVQRERRNPLTAESISSLALKTSHLHDAVFELLENNLETIPLAKKLLPKQLSSQEIEYYLEDNDELLKKMREQAKIAGLSSWNKLYRFIDSHMPPAGLSLAAPFLAAGAVKLLPDRINTALFRAVPRISLHPYFLLPMPDDNQPPLNWGGQAVVNIIKLFYAYSIYSKMFDILPAATQNELKHLVEDISSGIQQWWEDAKGYDANLIPTTYETIEHITLDDPRLIGIEDQKKLLWSIVNYLLDPELFVRQGAHIAQCILFVGPSRCGKTLAAKALGGTINKLFAERGITHRVVFREVQHHELWEGNLKKIIEEAKRMAPCILFIDELHNLDYQTQHKSTTRLAEALTALDDLHLFNDPRYPVFIIGATNRPDLLDPALLTYKRFGEQVHFKLPTFATRKQFFEENLKTIAADPHDFDLDMLAHITEHCPYGDLQKVFEKARLATNNVESIKQHHFLTAIDRSIRNMLEIVPTDPQTKRIVAAHQAGHALGYLLLNTHEHLDTVTIRGINQKITETNEWTEPKSSDKKTRQHEILYGGTFTYHDDEDMPFTDQQELRKHISIHLAGKIAEDILLGTHSLSYHPADRAHAFDLAKMVLLDGLVEKDLSKHALYQLADDAQKIVTEAEMTMKKLLMNNKELLAAIATALEERHSLKAQDLRDIMAQHPVSVP